MQDAVWACRTCFRTSRIGCRTISLGRMMSRMGCSTSKTGSLMNITGCRTSMIGYWTSKIGCLMSRIVCRASWISSMTSIKAAEQNGQVGGRLERAVGRAGWAAW